MNGSGKIAKRLGELGKTVRRLAVEAGENEQRVYNIIHRVDKDLPVSPRSKATLALVLQTSVEDLFDAESK